MSNKYALKKIDTTIACTPDNCNNLEVFIYEY